MLDNSAMNLIQDLKKRGYSQSEIQTYFKEHNFQVPSRPTIAKYYRMDAVPDNPGEKLAKDKVFDAEPFKTAIISIIKRCDPKKLRVSSIYDVLIEQFVETGKFESLPGNEQTLRNYVRYLKESEQVDVSNETRRVYDHVFDTPPGHQMLLDFGEYPTTEGKKIHFICLLLRYSRYLCVYAQDHPFTSADACNAIYRSFCKIGGRPKELVIDQDAVFIVNETAGELQLTKDFDAFCSEQNLKIWACNKADPESKGPIENSVSFVKKSFFSARTIRDIDDVNNSLPGWLKRQNSRVHKATYCVPQEILNEYEKPKLCSLIPSAYEFAISELTKYNVPSQPYIQYKTNKYSVPREYAYKKVLYKATDTHLYVYDTKGNSLCVHTLSECKGQYIQLDEHKKPESTDWIPIAERMREKWKCYDFQHFINGVKRENYRYMAQQLIEIESYFDKENATRALVAKVMHECCKNLRYKFSQIKEVFDWLKANDGVARLKTDEIKEVVGVDHADMSTYQMRFDLLASDEER